MPLKQKITKEEFDAMDPVLQAEYKEVNGVMLLQFDGATDLSRAVAAEKLRADRAEARTNELATQITTLQTSMEERERATADKDKDIPALNASWQKKLDDAVKKGKEAVENLQRQFRQLLVHSKAEAIAAEISDSPKLLLPHIEAMLDVDFAGDMPTTRVLDPVTRKPSALTLEEMQKSFVDNPDFAAIIKGSGSSGGGAGTQRNPNGGGASKKLSEMTEAERVAFSKSNPDQFKQKATAEGFGRYGSN